MSNLTATSKAANVQVTLQSPTESNTQLLINSHYESSFLVEDLLKVQSSYDLKKIESFYSNVDEKFREFGEHRETTTPSRAYIMIGRCNDYVRESRKRTRDSLN